MKHRERRYWRIDARVVPEAHEWHVRRHIHGPPHLETGMIRSARDTIRRLRRLFAELDYAQRRLLEIRTGLVLTPETERAIARVQIDRLNALYEAEDHPDAAHGLEPAADALDDGPLI
jgi:hypothetical protein